MSLWQCRACGQLYHGQSPEQGGSPCVCARAALPSPSPPPTLTPASAPAPTAEPASTLSVADFDIGPLIGSGGYSKVFLCWLKGNEVTYALKVIDKKHVFAEEEQDHVLYELRVLAAHVPLANQLFFAFQDVYALYMVMDYFPGGDLFDLMRVHGPFDETQSRLYLAEVSAAVHHLHSAGFLHRDIKPENFLINAHGHLRLADFGFARPVLDPDDGLVVGSIHYIAPEVIDCVDYGPASDWWAVGIIMYEMLLGIQPFPDEYEQDVLVGAFDFKRHFASTISARNVEEGRRPLHASALVLMLGLLEPTAKLRIANFDAVARHAYFEGINWDDLDALQPPFTPAAVEKLQTAVFLHGGGAFRASPTGPQPSPSSTSGSSGTSLEGELQRIRKASMNTRLGNKNHLRHRSQSHHRIIDSPKIERRERGLHNHLLGMDEKFSATRMVPIEDHTSNRTLAADRVTSYDDLGRRIEQLRRHAASSRDVALFCDFATKLFYRFKATGPFEHLSQLDNSIVSDLAQALAAYSECHGVRAEVPATSAAVDALQQLPRSTSVGHLTVFGKRERPRSEVAAKQALPDFHYDYRSSLRLGLEH